MSLETLLEAAEFLEWNKSSGKKSSRATRTSKKAENYKPQLLTDRKRKVSGTKPVKVLTSAATSAASATTLSDFSLGGSSTFSDLAPTDQQQNITLKEIRKSLGNRETHNKLEKNRRAHLRECFDQLRKELPFVDERRASNLSTLKSAIRVIENLASRHKELEADKKRLQRLKSTRQAHINTLRKELRDKGVEYNIEDWIEGTKSSTNSTSTASECGDGVTDTLAVAAANSGVQNLIEAAAAEQPRSIQPAPLPSEMQLVIKPAPNAKSESATNVTMQATPLQTVHLVQQGGLTAQPQTLMMAPTQLAGTLVNKIVIPSASGDVLSSTASTQHQQLAPTNTQVPQVYTVTKLPGSAGPTNLSSKILLAPKSLSQLATTTTTISKSPEMTANQTIAQLIHPQLCTLSDGQMILAPANSEPPSVPQAVTPNTANFFIASAPGNESQQLQAMSGHPQPLTVSADSLSSFSSVGTTPVMFNLQSGRLVNQQQQPQLVYSKGLGNTALISAVDQTQQTNLNIAPKQLVLIAASTSTPTLTQHTVRPQQRHAALPSGVTLVAAPPSQPQNILQLASTTTSATSSKLTPDVSSSAPPPAASTTAAPAPTIIAGMLPTTAADGTVTYVPIQLTASKPNITNVLPASTRQLYSTTTTSATVLPTSTNSSTQLTIPFSATNTAGGLTFVIPQATSNTSMGVTPLPRTIQLVASPHSQPSQFVAVAPAQSPSVQLSHASRPGETTTTTTKS